MGKRSLLLASGLLGSALLWVQGAQADTLTRAATEVVAHFQEPNSTYSITGPGFELDGTDFLKDFPLAPYEPGQPIAGSFGFAFGDPYGTGGTGTLTIDNVQHSVFFYKILGFSTSLAQVIIPNGAGNAPLVSGTVDVNGTVQGDFFACVIDTPPFSPCDFNSAVPLAEITVDLPATLSIDFDFSLRGVGSDGVLGSSLSAAAVPEPSSIALILIGSAATGVVSIFRRRRALNNVPGHSGRS